MTYKIQEKGLGLYIGMDMQEAENSYGVIRNPSSVNNKTYNREWKGNPPPRKSERVNTSPKCWKEYFTYTDFFKDSRYSASQEFHCF